MAAGADESTEQVVLELPTVRCNKRNGMLLLTSQRIAWAEELSSEYKISHRFSQKISSEQSNKVQLQLVLHNDSSIKFQFLGETSTKDRNKVKDYLLKVLNKSKPTNEIDEKWRLLNEDQNLYQTYKDLVVGGAISAEEFWANRAVAINKNKNDEQQTSGLPSAFLADVRAEADGCNSVKYNLTSDTISSIFRCYPAGKIPPIIICSFSAAMYFTVKKKHAQMVPDKMSESDFWVMFFQSHHFHRDRSKSKKDLFSECLQKDMQELAEPSSTAELDLLQSSDATVAEGYGIQTMSAQVTGDKSLGQRCNVHSAMVLRALDTSVSKTTEASSSQKQISDDLPTTELLPEQATTVATLHIESQDTVIVRDTPSQPLLDLANQMQQWAYDPQMQAAEPPNIPLPVATQSKDVDAELVRHYSAVNELLRHFWACFPTRTPLLEQKLIRMAESLERYQAVQLAAYQKTLPTTHTVEHLNSCISLALERYRLWNARKGSKR